MEINRPASSIIIFIIILLLVFLFIVPKYQQSHNLEVTLANKQAEYEGKSDYYGKISDLILQIENKGSVLQKIQAALPSGFSIAPLTYFFEKNAQKHGIAVKSFSFSQVSMGALDNGIKNMMVTVTISGTYQGLRNFIVSLEKSARLFDIKTVSLSPVEGLNSRTQSQLKQYDMKLEVTTHAY